MPMGESVVVALGDSSRVYLSFSLTNTAVQIFLSTRQQATNGNGVLLSSDRTFWELSYRTHGSLVGYQWFGRIAGAADSLWVVENRFDPYQHNGSNQWADNRLSRHLR